MKALSSEVISLICLLLAASALAGCASTESAKSPSTSSTTASAAPASGGVTLKKDKDIQGVWLKPGFNFGGHPALTIEPTLFKAKERDNEAKMRAFAVEELRHELMRSLRDTTLFSSVTAPEPGAPAATNAYRLVNTIVEFEKGGGGARYWAGMFGGGQPVIKVHGEMFDTDNQLVFVYEAKRSGEGAGARMAGVFMSDEEIQRKDINDLAIDLADYTMRAAGLTPPKR